MPQASQEKVRLNPAGIFPRDTCQVLNRSELLIELVQKVSGPISAQIRAIDLWARCLNMIEWWRMDSAQCFDADRRLEEDVGQRKCALDGQGPPGNNLGH